MCIEAAVGPGKANQNQDVLIVQALLNLRYVKQKICGIDELTLDGGWGKGTLGAIQRFQRTALGQANPTGIVAPESAELKELLKNVPIPLADWDQTLLAVCMPKGAPAKAAKFAGPLKRTMAAYGISTGQRAAHFLAQVGHETMSLQWETEIASGAAYEGRTDLGNTQPGDGKKFKGRGLIQLTGRANYAAYGKDKNLDLVKEPEKVATDPELNADVAGWYWKNRDLNSWADKNDIQTITKKVNGGLNGYADRIRRFKVCYVALVALDATQLKGWSWLKT
jgi:putative chitinase